MIIPKGSGGGGRPGRTGGGGGDIPPDEAGAMLLKNLRSGKLSQADAEAAADALLTASMKSKTPEEGRMYGKKYAAAMDAIDAYKAERGAFKPPVEKTAGQVAYERYQAKRKYEGYR